MGIEIKIGKSGQERHQPSTVGKLLEHWANPFKALSPNVEKKERK